VTGATKYPAGKSLVEVQLKSGHVLGIICDVNPSIIQHTVQVMRDSGYVQLWNKQESIAVCATEVVAVRVTKLTTEEPA